MPRLLGTAQLHQKQRQGPGINKVIRMPLFVYDKSAVDRGRMQESLRGCRICTSWLHNATRCHQLRSSVKLYSNREERGKRCIKGHHTSLHMSQSAYCQAMSDQQRTTDDQAMSPRAGISPRLRCPVCKSQLTLAWANGEIRSSSRLLGCDIFAKKAALKKRKIPHTGDKASLDRCG